MRKMILVLALGLVGCGGLEELRSRPAAITGIYSGEFSDLAECTYNKLRPRYAVQISSFPRDGLARIATQGDTWEMSFRQSSPGAVTVESRSSPTLFPEKKENSPFWQAVESCSKPA